MPHIALVYTFLCTYKEVEKEPAIMIEAKQQIIFEISQNQSKYIGKSHGCFMATIIFRIRSVASSVYFIIVCSLHAIHKCGPSKPNKGTWCSTCVVPHRIASVKMLIVERYCTYILEPKRTRLNSNIRSNE